MPFYLRYPTLITFRLPFTVTYLYYGLHLYIHLHYVGSAITTLVVVVVCLHLHLDIYTHYLLVTHPYISAHLIPTVTYLHYYGYHQIDITATCAGNGQQQARRMQQHGAWRGGEQ